MRVAIISGGRDYHPTPEDLTCLDATLQLHEISHVIHGGARGADMGCHKHLKSNGKAWLIVVPALWDVFGKGAGPRRNKLMADVAHAMTGHLAWQPCKMPLWILFPGGKGTANAEGLATHDGFEIVRIGQ
jgi:hypothetical protein